MRVRRALAAVGVLGGVPVAAQQFDSIMTGSFGSFFVKNASGSDVRCAFRLGNARWSPWFAFGADAEFNRYAKEPDETLRFFWGYGDRGYGDSAQNSAPPRLRVNPVCSFARKR